MKLVLSDVPRLMISCCILHFSIAYIYRGTTIYFSQKTLITSLTYYVAVIVSNSYSNMYIVNAEFESMTAPYENQFHYCDVYI